MHINDPLDTAAERSAARGGFVDLRQPFSDQSDADQSGADADRVASADDEAASTADHLAALDDQHASDRDQAAADSAHGAADDLTPKQEQAYEVARDERLVVSAGRKHSNAMREKSARLRSATAALRDRISRPRKRSSAIRRQLIAEGESPEMAIRWCDAWEVAAERQGVDRDGDYWSRGTEWIWTERAAGRPPSPASA